MKEPSSSTTACVPCGIWFSTRLSRGTARKVNCPRARTRWTPLSSRSSVIRVRASRCSARATATAIPTATPSSTPPSTTATMVVP